MKINGTKLEPPKPIDIVLPRGNDDVVRFKLQAIVDFDEFDKACPYPRPPMITRPGKKAEPDSKDEGFQKDVIEWYDRRRGWTYLKSFSATPGLEWETVSLSDPTTWSHAKFIKELRDSGFTSQEIGILITGVERANLMDEKHMEEVRNRFLQQEAASSS